MPENLYPLAIASISFCLLYQVLWMSPYLIGWDVHDEYFLFESVKSSGHWILGYYDTYNSALSVTILPAMVQPLLAADDTAIFKTMYPLAFSVVPVIMYLAYKYVVDSKRAVISAIFLMSYSAYFSEVSFIGKQEIAEVIFALLILLTLSRSRAKGYGMSMTMMILIAGLIVSHYSSSYIYLSFLFLSYILLAGLKRPSVVPFSFVVLSALLAFCWYIYTAGGAAFTTLVQFGDRVYVSVISEFFNPGTRGQVVLEFFGIGVRPALVNSIDLLVHWSIQVFIVVGVVTLWKRRKSVNGDFLSYACISLFLLVSSVLLPYFESGINMSRIYQIALIFLSPACVLGGERIFGTLSQTLSALRPSSWHPNLSNRDRNLVSASCIIIVFLLFNTGVIHEISGAPPISISLGLNRMRGSNDPGLVTFLYGTYFPEQDHTSALWLSKYIPDNEKYIPDTVCGDRASRLHVLLSYAGIPLEEGGAAVPLMHPGSEPSCTYVYLSYMNAIEGFGYGPKERESWSMSEVSNFLNDRNRIYSGGSDILSKT